MTAPIPAQRPRPPVCSEDLRIPFIIADDRDLADSEAPQTPPAREQDSDGGEG